MILGIIRGFLGNVGQIMLDFYMLNSLWINSLVLFYGLLVFLARQNYNRIWYRLLLEIGFDPSKPEKKLKITKTIYEKINWKSVVSSSKIPFISLPGKWTLIPKNLQKLQEIFDLENLKKLLNEQIL